MNLAFVGERLDRCRLRSWGEHLPLERKRRRASGNAAIAVGAQEITAGVDQSGPACLFRGSRSRDRPCSPRAVAGDVRYSASAMPSIHSGRARRRPARPVRSSARYRRSVRGRDRPAATGGVADAPPVPSGRGFNRVVDLHPAHVRADALARSAPTSSRWRGCMWRMPPAARRSSNHARNGRPATGASGLGTSSTMPRRRVPKPPARTMASSVAISRGTCSASINAHSRVADGTRGPPGCAGSRPTAIAEADVALRCHVAARLHR